VLALYPVSKTFGTTGKQVSLVSKWWKQLFCEISSRFFRITSQRDFKFFFLCFLLLPFQHFTF